MEILEIIQYVPDGGVNLMDFDVLEYLARFVTGVIELYKAKDGDEEQR